MRRRVVITGLGTVNPLGTDVKTTWDGLLAGKSGIGQLTLLDHALFKVHIGGEVWNFKPENWIEHKADRRLDRFAQFGVVAAIDAVKDSGLDFDKEDRFRCGCMIGSGIGGLSEYEEQHTKYMEGGGP